MTVRPAALAALVLLATGCGKPAPRLVPVAGKVVQAGGQPVAAGTITFYPQGDTLDQGSPPSCQLAADGSFALKTYPFGDGAPPGRYKVTLDSTLAGRLKKPLYADPGKTPWLVTVPDAGVTDLTLEVK